jgi:flagellar hook-basal body complex protein FliE
MRITDTSSINSLLPGISAGKSEKANGFQDLLRDAIVRVENSRTEANQAVEQFVSGQNEDLHSTVLATQRASLDFDLLLQVRNKVIQSYQEIMRMQL